MLEILKSLLELPHNIGKHLIRISKLTMILVFAIWLYKYYIGPFKFLGITDGDGIMNFFLSGRVLICAAMFILSQITLFEILPIFTVLPFMLIAKKFAPKKVVLDQSATQAINTYLDLLNIVNHDKISKKFTAGKNAEYAVGIIKKFLNKKKFDIHDYKNTYVSDVWHVYILFVLSYFLYLNNSGLTSKLSILIITVTIVLPFFYVFMVAVLETLTDHGKTLIAIIEHHIIQRKTNETLNEMQIKPTELCWVESKIVLPVIFSQGENFVIYHHPEIHPIQLHNIESCIEIIEKEKKKVLLITKAPFTKSADLRLKEKPDDLLLLSYKNKKDISRKLKEMFYPTGA